MSNGSHQTFSSSSDPNTIPWDVPYKTPPAGVTSNFDHPDTHTRDTIIITLAVTLGIALIFFFGRIGTRTLILRSVGWDDFLCVCGVAFSVAFNATVLERESSSIFTDVVLFFLPLPMAYSLNMPLKQKVAFTWVLTTGLFCCIASIVCFIISLRIIRQQSTEDILQLWAIIECNIAIICICLPTMQQLITRKLGFESSRKSPSMTPNNSFSKNRFLSPGRFFASKASSFGTSSSGAAFSNQTTQPPPPSRHFDPLTTTDSEKAYAAVHLEKGGDH